jgi:hypothetical protein
MPNPLEIIDMSCLSLPHVPLATRIISVGEALAVHPGFQKEFPPEIPGPKELKETGTMYSVLNAAAESLDRGKVAERDAFREKAKEDLALTLTWVAIRAVREKNRSLIANIGVEPKKKAQPRTTAHSLVDAPKALQVKHGEVSGAVTVTVGKVKGGVTYIVQACQGDPTKEESWTGEWQSPKCRGIQLTGLEPGKIYYFRVRCFGHAGHGPWSAIVKLMVI